jgi:hypothetical protein
MWMLALLPQNAHVLLEIPFHFFLFYLILVSSTSHFLSEAQFPCSCACSAFVITTYVEGSIFF